MTRIKIITGTRKRVRCLGVGAEHTFVSHDPKRNRICDRCRKKLAEVRISNIYSTPAGGRDASG